MVNMGSGLQINFFKCSVKNSLTYFTYATGQGLLNLLLLELRHKHLETERSKGESQHISSTLQLPMIQMGQLGIDFVCKKGFVNSNLNVPTFTKPGCYECQ